MGRDHRSFRMFTIWRAVGVAAVLVLGVISVGRSPARAVTASATTCYAEPRSAADFDAIFRGRPGGIAGADYPRAFPLPDGRTLWIFQDVFFGTDDTLADDGFALNAALVQRRGCFTGLNGGTTTPLSYRSYVGGAIEVPLRRWFWPLDGEVGADGALWVFFVEMDNPNGTGAALGAAPVSTWVARIDPSSLAVLSFAPAADSGNRLFGWSVSSDANFSYLFSHCYRQFIPGTLLGHDTRCANLTMLARVPRGRFGDTPEYWNGSGWTPNARDAVSVFTRGLANPMSVQRINGRWVSVTKNDDWWSNTMTLDVADEPWGPWTTAETVAVASRCGSPCNTSGAQLLPWADPDGRLQVALSHNAWDMVGVAFPDARWYRPGMVTMTPLPASMSFDSGSYRSVPLVPARLADTRSGVGVRPGPLNPGEVLEIPVAGRGGVPADASGAVLNLAVVTPRGDGFVTVWPCGAPRPFASAVNFTSGQVIANGVHVRLGAGGSVCVSSLVPTHVVVDVTGGYGPSGDGLWAVTPWRALDTRQSAPVAGGSALAVQVAGVGDVPTSGVRAVTLNVTSVDALANGFATVWPCDQPRPFASSLNLSARAVRSNGVTVPVAADGTVCIFTNVGSQYVVDVMGWWGDGGVSAEPRTPVRLLDTRVDGGALLAGQVRQLATSGPTAGARALAATITVTQPATAGFVTAWPCSQPRPTTSVSNYAVGQTVANNAVVAVDEVGTVCLFSSSDVHLVIDLDAVFR